MELEVEAEVEVEVEMAIVVWYGECGVVEMEMEVR